MIHEGENRLSYALSRGLSLSVLRSMFLNVALALAMLSPWWAGSAAAQGGACPDSIRVGMVFPMTGREGRPGSCQVEKNDRALAPFVIIQNKPGDKVDFVYPEDTKTGEAVTKIPR